MMTTIECRDVYFAYRSTPAAPALDGVTFTFGGGVTGVVGPNGAGKSTLLRLLAGLLEPTRGSIWVDGASPAALRLAGGIGLVPEAPALPDYLTTREFLAGLARLTDAEAVRMHRLADIADRRLGTLSLGQKRKVELAAALTGDPHLLLLDEPTNGLDPFATAHLRETISDLNDGKRAIVVSSHHLDELQRTADRVLIFARGRCRGCWQRDLALREFGSIEGLFQVMLSELPLGGTG